MTKNISAKELLGILKADPGGVELIDVRDADEYALIRIKGAKLIGGSTLDVRLDEIDWKKKVVFYCRSGARSRLAANFASGKTGRDVYNLEGGIAELYREADKSMFEIGGSEENLKNYF
jgi:sulfur-carrier protein adenylyltransferase/sulfurtransferase